jgi:hypothetical protein
MDKHATKIFEWLRTCPLLSDLWSIAAQDDYGTKVVLPQGSSEKMYISEHLDVNGDYECEKIPLASLFEDYQINCYEFFSTTDDKAPARNYNVLRYEEVKKVCEWIEEQDETGFFPDIGENVVSVEVIPFVPQIRFADPSDNTIAYFITLRVRYVNRNAGRRRTVEYYGNFD